MINFIQLLVFLYTCYTDICYLYLKGTGTFSMIKHSILDPPNAIKDSVVLEETGIPDQNGLVAVAAIMKEDF